MTTVSFSNNEIGLIYNLLRSVNDELLETIPSVSPNTPQVNPNSPESRSKHVRLNKLIVSNLKQKLQGELSALQLCTK